MSIRDALLQEINKDIPAGVDWGAGARAYVKNWFQVAGNETAEMVSMSKPFRRVGKDQPEFAINENAHYLNNFANAISLVKPRLGSRVLDVACGGGWVSHYLSKMGYWSYGIDISSDFIDLARKRLASDFTLDVTEHEARERFSVLDLETERLPEHLRGTFDFIWLESCLHHFVDPISAMEHLVEGLNPDGVVVLIEFENREGPLKDEYVRVMRDFDTLERPYSRGQLEGILDLVGLSEREFVGSINGWFSPHDPASALKGEHLLDAAAKMNIAICSKTKGRLDPMFPHRISVNDILFGKGFYDPSNGYRWAAPTAYLTAGKDMDAVSFEVFGNLPQQLGREQVVVAYSQDGERGRIALSPEVPYGTLALGDLKKGQQITFHSIEAFRPSWTGSDDDRLLSFYIRSDN